jgi:hypothetical protein
MRKTLAFSIGVAFGAVVALTIDHARQAPKIEIMVKFDSEFRPTEIYSYYNRAGREILHGQRIHYNWRILEAKYEGFADGVRDESNDHNIIWNRALKPEGPGWPTGGGPHK